MHLIVFQRYAWGIYWKAKENYLSLNCNFTCLHPESLLAWFQLQTWLQWQRYWRLWMNSERTLSVLPSGSILSKQHHQFLAGTMACSDHFLCHNCVILITSPSPAESPQVLGGIVFCISDNLPPRLLSLETGLHVALTDTTMNWVFCITAGLQTGTSSCAHSVSPHPELLWCFWDGLTHQPNNFTWTTFLKTLGCFWLHFW